MPILDFPNDPSNEPPFFSDIREDGYHVYSLESAAKTGFYPPELPNYPGVALKDIQEDDIITIRVFFGIGKGNNMRVDGGYISLQVELVEEDKLMGVITTELPVGFALCTGESLEIFADEILYKDKVK